MKEVINIIKSKIEQSNLDQNNNLIYLTLNVLMNKMVALSDSVNQINGGFHQSLMKVNCFTLFRVLLSFLQSTSLNLFFSTCFRYYSSSFSPSSSIVRIMGGSSSLLISLFQSIPLKNGCLFISVLSITPILCLGFLFNSFYSKSLADGEIYVGIYNLAALIFSQSFLIFSV